MNRLRWNALFTTLGALLSLLMLDPAQGAPTDEVTALLRDADRYRAEPDTALQVETEVRVLKADGNLDKERRYTVLLQPGHRSLVLMRSPAEAGQKVLMLGDDFWLLMPGSQRPMRITPMQKLLGDAATGDIATLSWSEDYAGSRIGGEERCGEGSAARPCLHLSLKATRPGVTYPRIELWLGATRHEPLRADLYVLSDKLAKQARFVFDRADKPTQVDAMELVDQLSRGKVTQVRYLSRRPRQIPETWMNPMFLARNPALETP
jgi:hypothetical protein